MISIAPRGKTVLAPAIGLAAREVVGEIPPGVAVGAVDIAPRAPGALAHERSPTPPLGRFPLDVLESSVFRCVVQRHVATSGLCIKHSSRGGGGGAPRSRFDLRRRHNEVEKAGCPPPVDVLK